MGWKETAAPVLTRMPGVRRPEGHVPFKRKLTWTVGVLILYFFLTNVSLFGVGQGTSPFGNFSALLAAQQGSLLQLGIGPIVTASIVLQLLNGADLLGLDTQQPRDQMIYQGLQKALVLVMVCLTGLPMVFLGDFLPADPGLAADLGIGTVGVNLLIFAQVAAGGVLVLYMDEVISKWGVGSGIGLFIVAGVSQSLMIGLLYWGGSSGQAGFIPTWIDYIIGGTELPPLLSSAWIETIVFDSTAGLLLLATTLLIFVVVVYAESVRIEVPLSHSRMSGGGGSYPLKLIYASVLPMILVRALQANVQMVGRLLNSEWTAMPPWVGVYSDGQPVGGLFYYLAPIHSPNDWMWWIGTTTQETWQILLRVGTDLTIMVIGGAIFAIFWVETADMGPDAKAREIVEGSPMQIDGHRQNLRSVEKYMERYIPKVTVLGGALVGLLAVMANMMGTIGQVSGTGLLLAISITYKLYEEIAEEQLREMYPMMRQMFGD